MAPRIHGLLDAEEVHLLLKRFTDVLESYFPGFSEKNLFEALSGAIVMDKIQGAWNFRKSSRIPIQETYWNLPSVIAQLDQIHFQLNAWGLRATDPQPTISEEGAVLMIDFTNFVWTPWSKRQLERHWQEGTREIPAMDRFDGNDDGISFFLFSRHKFSHLAKKYNELRQEWLERQASLRRGP